MKVIKEAIDNVAKVSCYQGDVPMVMAMEKQASDKRNDDIKKELDAHRKATGADEKKPFGGERESGFPKNMKNREALKKMKLSEKLFTESAAGEWSEKLYDWAHENFYTGGNEDLCLTLIDDFINWLSEDEVKEFCIGNGYDELFEDGYGESLTENNAAAENDQKWVDYDEKKYGRVSKQTARDIKRSGSRLVKDDEGEYEVVADESLTEEVGASMRPYMAKRKDEGIVDGYIAQRIEDRVANKGTKKVDSEKNEGLLNAAGTAVGRGLAKRKAMRDAEKEEANEGLLGDLSPMAPIKTVADAAGSLVSNVVGGLKEDGEPEKVGASMRPYLAKKDEDEEDIDEGLLGGLTMAAPLASAAGSLISNVASGLKEDKDKKNICCSDDCYDDEFEEEEEEEVDEGLLGDLSPMAPIKTVADAAGSLVGNVMSGLKEDFEVDDEF